MAYLPLDSWYTISLVHEKIKTFNCNKIIFWNYIYKMFMNKWKNSIIINMVKEIQLWPMWQKFCWRMLFESGHRNCSWKKLWIQLWSLWQKFHQKYFAKGFKLKVHIKNVHEIEKIKYESINDILEMISTFRNLQNLNVKFVKRNY